MSTKTSQSIQVEYKMIMTRVTELNAYSDELDSVSTKLDTIIESLASGWQGESATAYINKCNALKSEITSTADAIRQTAETVSSMAAAYKKAELAALGIIEFTWTNS